MRVARQRPSSTRTHPDATYARDMMFLVLVAIVVVGFVLYRLRVPLLARILGQPEDRIKRLQQRRKP